MSFDWSTVPLEEMLQRAYENMDDLQRPGVAKARASGRAIFDVYMGVGKTYMGLTSGLCFKPQRWLVLCSKNALNAWKQEVKKWFPELLQTDRGESIFGLVRGSAAERQQTYREDRLFYVTTPGSFIRDIEWLIETGIAFDVVSVDEPQKVGLRNKNSQGFKAVKEITRTKHHIRSQRVVRLKKLAGGVSLINFMTGSLTAKGIPQLWGYLHLLSPQEFSSYWRFVNTYTVTYSGPFGRVIGPAQNTEGLALATKPYIYRVTEEQARGTLPDLRRIKLPFELDPTTQRVYDSYSQELYAVLDGEEPDGSDARIDMVSTTIHKYMKLRQLVCCPAIIDPKLGVGNAIEAIVDKILENDEVPHFRHNVIFTPFIPSIPLFHDYVAEGLKMSKSDILILQGGLEPEDVQRVETTYRKNKETLVICSVLFAQSFNLETGLDAYFAHFSWDQDDNKQAESRIRRKTSDSSRMIGSYYATAENTVTEEVFDILNSKVRRNNLTYQDFARLKSSLIGRKAET